MVIKTSVRLHAEIQSGEAEKGKNTMGNVFPSTEALLPLTSFYWLGKVAPILGILVSTQYQVHILGASIANTNTGTDTNTGLLFT